MSARGIAGLALICGVIAAADRDPLLEASELLERGAAPEAAQKLEAFVVEHPDHADAQRLRGLALALIPRRSEALKALERAVELAPENAANHLALGQALSRFGDNDRAKEAFEAALGRDGELWPAREGLALSFAIAGRLEAAIEQLSAALEQVSADSNKARLHYLRGRARAQSEQAEPAADDFEQATRLNPGLAPAYLEWAQILAEQPDNPEAERVSRKAVELLPDSFEAQRLLGSYLLRSGRAEAAVAPLQAAVRLNPGDRPTSYALGRALRAAGRTEEARRHLASLASANAGRATSEADINEAGRLNNLGLELEKAGEYEAALRNYEAASEIAPDNLGFQRNAALALCRLDRWEEAKLKLREVLEMAPGDVDATKALYIALEHAPDQP